MFDKVRITTITTINDNNNSVAASLGLMSNLGIPLTSSMSIEFTIGSMKG